MSGSPLVQALLKVMFLIMLALVASNARRQNRAATIRTRH